jgi:hypothetical protein
MKQLLGVDKQLMVGLGLKTWRLSEGVMLARVLWSIYYLEETTHKLQRRQVKQKLLHFMKQCLVVRE